MYSISISVIDNATPWLARVAERLRDPGIKRAAGHAVANLLRDHFSDLESARSGKQMPGAATHFYADAARSVQEPQDVPAGVSVAVNKTGIAQRRFGRTIRPVNSQYLTIPARTEAYGHRAREFNFLEVLYGRDKKPVALVDRPRSDFKFRRRKKGAFFEVTRQPGALVWYWLVKSVQQYPDEEVLPDDATIGETARTAISAAIARAASREGGFAP